LLFLTRSRTTTYGLRSESELLTFPDGVALVLPSLPLLFSDAVVAAHQISLSRRLVSSHFSCLTWLGVSSLAVAFGWARLFPRASLLAKAIVGARHLQGRCLATCHRQQCCRHYQGGPSSCAVATVGVHSTSQAYKNLSHFLYTEAPAALVSSKSNRSITQSPSPKKNNLQHSTRAKEHVPNFAAFFFFFSIPLCPAAEFFTSCVIRKQHNGTALLN
jgi:hypothetical protein